MADDSHDQSVRDAEFSVEASGARADPEERKTGIAGLIAKVMALRPVRVFLHYSNDNGPLIASGMTYQAVFALFAALWFTFSIAGFVIAGDLQLQARVFQTINQFIPNLIAYDAGRYGSNTTGTIPSTALLGGAGLTVSGIISLVGVLFTAVGFLATLRTAIRIMFALPNPTTNFVILKLKDLGLTVAFGAVVLLTAAVSVVSNTVLDFILGLFGLGDATDLEQFFTSAVAFVVIAVIDTAIIAGALRILSGIRIPVRRLIVGALLGGVGLAILQTLGTQLLGGATRNPVVKVFATTVGVLLYFNFVSQVILIASSWVAVGMADAGIDARSLSPEQKETERAVAIEDARRLVARADQEALQNRIRESRGLHRWRLVRELEREVRAEARRRERVPTVSEYEDARTDAVPVPDAQHVGESKR